jgi:hypothetical protein
MDQLHILNSLSSRIALVCRASLPSLANNDLSVFALVGIDTTSVIIRNGQLRGFESRIQYKRKNMLLLAASENAIVCLFLCHGNSPMVRWVHCGASRCDCLMAVRMQTKSEAERCIQSVPGLLLPARREHTTPSIHSCEKQLDDREYGAPPLRKAPSGTAESVLGIQSYLVAAVSGNYNGRPPFDCAKNWDTLRDGRIGFGASLSEFVTAQFFLDKTYRPIGFYK